MKIQSRVLAGLLIAVAAGAAPSAAQTTVSDRGVMGTALKIRQLDGVKRVLMIAAHPDDEDTALLAALARGMGAETAYLSLSRGEGGQNLIGPELHEGLGIIRTGELVAARALDGGKQFFTRAFDFGYSRNIEEARGHWPAEEVLRDVVWVIRTFRPHVIVSVFSGTERDGHGQHQMAGVAAIEGFEAAGDPSRFPELEALGARPWTPTKLYRSARFSPQDQSTALETGAYDAVLGYSHFQLAMASRSQHRSQDMGVSQFMGPRQSPLQLMESRVDTGANDEIFAGIDTTLAGQLPAELAPRAESMLEAYRVHIREAETALSASAIHNAVDPLLAASAELGAAMDVVPAGPDRRVLERRMEQLTETILAAAGIVTDARLARDVITPGESTVLDVTVWNGGPFDVSDVAPLAVVPDGWRVTQTEESAQGPPRSPFFRPSIPPTPTDGRVPAGEIARWSFEVQVPLTAAVTAGYHMESPRDGDMYTWPDEPDRWALPTDPSPVQASVTFSLSGTSGAHGPFQLHREAEYVGVDKAVGEYREAVLVTPALSVDVEPKQMVWPTEYSGSRAVTVVLTNSGSEARTGTLTMAVGEGWSVEPRSAEYDLPSDGASRSFVFEVIPTGDIRSGEHLFSAVATGTDGTRFDRSYDIIDYPHIRRAALFRPAEARVSAFPVVVDTDLRAGYVMGSGDDGAAGLRQMGMQVDLLDEARVREGNFDEYDVIVLGVRAYETRPDLVAANEDLIEFARRGGTVIVQYNKYEYPAGDFAPYPVEMNRPHGRVTDEEAEVAILEPSAPVFAGPNDIVESDFDGWVQERGLYFLSEWDDRFTPVLEMADPGRDPERGSLLVAEVGDGLYVYTGLAFFRQFPAGVPGAYRLFANLVSLRAAEWRRSRSAM